MNRLTPTIILTGGGSGGHITPLLSLARELKKLSPDCRIVYVGHKGDNFDSFKHQAGDFDFMVFIRAGKFRRYNGGLAGWFDVKTLMLNIRDALRLPGSIISAYRIMRKFKPNVVFSKGSFVAVPVGFAAHLRKIPIVTHDSDAVPGLANRVVGRWAKMHATGMPVEYYDYPPDTIEYVGIPVDPSIQKITPKLKSQARRRLNLPADSQILLVSGGGNGSQSINDLMLAVAAPLLETNLALHIVHIAGSAHEAGLKRSYRSFLPKLQQNRIHVHGFTSDFNQYITAADLVLGRAGATTLTELALAGQAVILIPAEFLSGGHQLKNAEMYAAADAAVVLDGEVQADELLAIINELLNDNSRRFELSKNIHSLAKPDAAAKLAGLILKEARD